LLCTCSSFQFPDLSAPISAWARPAAALAAARSMAPDGLVANMPCNIEGTLNHTKRVGRKVGHQEKYAINKPTIYGICCRSSGRTPMPVIGFLDSRSPDAVVDRLRALRLGLKVEGYVEGENVALVYRWAENQIDRLPALAAELVQRSVSLIVAV